MWYLISFLAFALIGGWMVVRGWRGRPVPREPACAKCGYDLRGAAILERCSECGSDLTIAGAVRTDGRQRSRAMVFWGVLVIATPWTFWGFLTLRNWFGPGWERVRTNAALVAEIGSADPSEPWAWDELARRVASGRLRGPEATAAVDGLIRYLNQPGTAVRYSRWWQPFFVASDKAGVISGPQYVALAKRLYGTPRVDAWEPQHTSDNGISVAYRSDAFGFVPGVHEVLTVRQVSMTGASARPEEIAKRPGQGSMPPPDINMRGNSPYLLLAPRVPRGTYTLKCILQAYLVRGGGGIDVQMTPLVGPPPLAQWTETILAPLQVTDPIYSRRPFAIRTDPAADPVRAGAISVVDARAFCYRDKTIVSIRLKVGRVPVGCWFTPVLTLNGKQAAGTGRDVFLPQWPDRIDGASAEFGPTPPEVRTVDLELKPQIQWAIDSREEQAWGKPIVFTGIPLKRYELQAHLAPPPPVVPTSKPSQTKPATRP